MNDKALRGKPENRTFITVPMSQDMKDRITKAAGRRELSTARYIRELMRESMERNNEWAIPGPRKGSQ